MDPVPVELHPERVPQRQQAGVEDPVHVLVAPSRQPCHVGAAAAAAAAVTVTAAAALDPADPDEGPPAQGRAGVQHRPLRRDPGQCGVPLLLLPR